MSFFVQAEDGIRDADVTGVQTCALPIFALGTRAGVSQPHFGPSSAASADRLAGPLRPSGGVAGNVCATGSIPGQLLSCRQLDLRGPDPRSHPPRSPAHDPSAGEGHLGLSAAEQLPKVPVPWSLF